MSRKDVTDRMIVSTASWLHSRPLEERCANLLDSLVISTNQHPNVVWRALERAERRGLIECGVSLRTAWATPKGRALLVDVGTKQ